MSQWCYTVFFIAWRNSFINYLNVSTVIGCYKWLVVCCSRQLSHWWRNSANWLMSGGWIHINLHNSYANNTDSSYGSIIVSSHCNTSHVTINACTTVCHQMPQSFHQMLHFSTGFIADDGRQLMSCENSCELEMVPMTRNLAKLWGSPRILRWVVSGRLLLHHTCSATIYC